jgi:hypothetical protein
MRHCFEIELHRQTSDRNSGEWIEGIKTVRSPIQPMPGLRIDLGDVCFKCHDVTYKAEPDLWIVHTPGSEGMYTTAELASRAKALERDGWTTKRCQSVERFRAVSSEEQHVALNQALREAGVRGPKDWRKGE